MIAEPQHVIGTQAIQLAVPRAADGRAWMDRASALWRTTLAGIAAEVFSRYCAPTERIRLDRLELELGTILPEDFDLELPERFRTALEAELRRRVSAAAHERRQAGVSAETSALELLEHVLLHGFIPWGAVVDTGYDPVDALVALLRREPPRLAALVRKIGRFRRVRTRLVYWLADPEIALLIRALAGGDAEFVLNYAADLQARHEREPIVVATREEFRHAKWEVILAHLLADRGSRFNTKSFLRQTLHDLAAHFRVEYGELLAELARVAILPGLTWREASLPQLLTELHVEYVVGKYRQVMEARHGAADENARPRSPNPAAGGVRSEAMFHETREIDAPRRDAEIPPYLRATLATSKAKASANNAGRTYDGRTASGDGSAAAPDIPSAPNQDRAMRWRLLEEDNASLVQEAWQALVVFREASAAWADILRDAAQPPSRSQELALQAWQALAPEVRAIAMALGSEGFPVGRTVPGEPDRTARRGRLALPVRSSPEPVERPAGDSSPVAFAAPTSSAASTGKPTAVTSDPADDVDLMPALRRLLETGALPATVANGWASVDPEAWLAFVLVRHQPALPPLLRAWARAGRLTVAMPERFADETLQLVVEVVEPAHAEEIGTFVHTARRGDPPLLGANPKSEAFRRATWTVVFDYVLSDRGSVFNTRSFLEYSIDRLAGRQRLQADAVLEYLLAAAEAEGRYALFHDLRAIADRRLNNAPVGPMPLDGSTELRGGRRLAGAGHAETRRDFDPRSDSRTDTGPDSGLAEGARTGVRPEFGNEANDADAVREFSPERTRRSSLTALRLLRLLLEDAAVTRVPAMAKAFPFLWRRLSAAQSLGTVRAFFQRAALSFRVIETLLEAEAMPTLEALVFAGEPAELATWRATLAWCEAHPSLVGIGSGSFRAFRATLWHALLREWQRHGGRGLRDMRSWLRRVLPAYGTFIDPSAVETRRSPGGAEAGLAEAGPSEADADRAALPRPAREDDAAAAPAEDEDDEPPATVVNEPIALTNAGLVLLAPFFPELHRRGGLLKDGTFRDFRANQEAVHLLQFLVAGEGRTREHSLVLNKILCGLDPACAVVPEVELGSSVRAAATALLENAVQQWPRGATLSIAGLRGTYLVRPGQLKRLERGAWSLKVEAKGWDILLAELPWTFGRIHPAWMPAPLIVDWI